MNRNQLPQPPQPPFPSFSLMMEKMEQYPFRLPAYRSSYLNRHHPYPRVKRPLDLMRTVDARFEEDDEDEWAIVDLDQSVGRRSNQADADSDSDTVLLQAALNPHTSLGTVSNLKRMSFTSLVIDLSLTVRRGCRRVLAAARRPSQSSLARSEIDKPAL